MSSDRDKQLKESMKNKKYRHAFVAAFNRRLTCGQLRAMREDREWTQDELGRRIDVRQSLVCRYERNYDKFNVQTLKRLAETFDVAFVYGFVPFSFFSSNWANRLSADSVGLCLPVPSFDDDPGMQLYAVAAADRTEVTWKLVSPKGLPNAAPTVTKAVDVERYAACGA